MVTQIRLNGFKHFKPGLHDIWKDILDEKCNDWHWQQYNRVCNLKQLEEIIPLTDSDHNCLVYCRFCTSKRKISDPDAVRIDCLYFENALKYISEHTEIREVVISGGDPFTFSYSALDYLLSHLRIIPHVQIVRLETCNPVTLPHGITDELVERLRKHQPVYVNTEFNHLKELDNSNWEKYKEQIMQIEKDTYEPARQDSCEFFSKIIHEPKSVSLIALHGDEVVGFCFGAPLESFPQVQGTQTDPEWNNSTIFYSADVTVAAKYREKGIALQLKQQQLKRARALGYRYVAGRNRVGLADTMWRLNAKFGAYQIQFLKNSYRDDLKPNDCIYYHINLDSYSRAM